MGICWLYPRTRRSFMVGPGPRSGRRGLTGVEGMLGREKKRGKETYKDAETLHEKVVYDVEWKTLAYD